jgi:hypothetical protein
MRIDAIQNDRAHIAKAAMISSHGQLTSLNVSGRLA